MQWRSVFANQTNSDERERAELRPQTSGTAPRVNSRTKLRSLILLPLVLFVSIASVSVLRWRQEYDERAESIRRQTEIAEQQFARRLEESIQEEVKPLRQVRRTWLLGGLRTQSDLAAAAAPIWHDRPSYRMVGWAGPDNVVRFVTPVAGNEALIGLDLRDEPHWSEAITQARRGKTESAAPLFNDPAYGWVTSFVMPIFAGDATDDDDYRGSITGQVDIRTMLGQLIDAHTLHNFHITIYDGPRVIYDTARQYRPQPRAVEPVRMLDRQLQLSLVPTEAFLAAHATSEPHWLLWGGNLAALLISLAVFQALHHRAREQQRSQAHLEALESLNQITAAITAHTGNGRDVLDKLTQTACNLMHATHSALLILDDDGDTLHLISTYGTRHPISYKLSDLPITRRCIETGKVVVVEDVLADNGPVNTAHMARYGYRAVLAVPLRVEEKSIGVLVMTHPSPRRFSRAEINLARVWGSHAAVTVVNMRLHEQTHQALREQKKLAGYSQALAAANAEIYQAGSFEESTRAIANVAPTALGVNLCVTGLIVNKTEIAIVAATGAYSDAIVGKRITLAGSNTERIFRSRRPLVIENAPDDPSINPEFCAQMDVGSMIYVPMFRTDESPLGALVFVRHQPGPFSPEQITLAEVFSRRAAGALENAWLHENARRDADAKAMLLRELNHRVKNNLAGIVGLLTTNEPDLPPEARQWLNRVIERIGTIARAHNLFSGGIEHVGLSELVQQVLPSLSVLKPPGVIIRMELDAVDISLRTERAVSMAMVLHELCANAIIHGLDGDGVVTIRARGLPDSRVAIDVIDDGSGMASGEPPCPPRDEEPGRGGSRPGVAATLRTGIGLTLVEGLVKRELNGHFSLHCPPGGGTVATVEFPLLPEESEEVYL